jgi:hypothetical protein
VTQNTSHAVMAQRKEPHDSLDFFPTPPFATRAFCEWLKAWEGTAFCDMSQISVWEPACGRGDMSRPLFEYFGEVFSSDVHDYGFGNVVDFLYPTDDAAVFDWIITNPPFKIAEQFITKAMSARRGVAMLVRTAFLESADRYEKLFKLTPPSDVLQFVERVPMFKGRLDRSGSTATSYCWLVWRKNLHGFAASDHTALHWLAPCRKRLERDSDYLVEARQPAEAAE